MIQENEKDNFWLIVAGIVITMAAVMWFIKSSEHGKYETAAKAIAEDASNSAYHVSK